MKRKITKLGFTLIELLMVVAIIGILAGILIPVAGTVREKANIAASKSQISGYINAINMFKGEYNYFPFTDLLDENEQLDLSDDTNAKRFIETLSARDVESYDKVPGEDGNRRQIEFISFSETDYYLDQDTGDLETNKIADRFNNRNIIFAIDADGDGLVTVEDPDDPSSEKELRSSITAFVRQNSSGAPAYYLYE